MDEQTAVERALRENRPELGYKGGEGPNWGERYLANMGKHNPYTQYLQDYYYPAQKKLLDQDLNPYRNVSVGEVSRVTGVPLSDLAAPEQRMVREVMEPSEVPSYRYIPTQRMEPLAAQTHGWAGRLEPNPSADAFYRSMGVEPPQRGLEPMDTSEQVLRDVRPQIRPMFNEPVGRLEETTPPQISVRREMIDPNQPSTLAQQQLYGAGVELHTKWPRSITGSSTADKEAQRAIFQRLEGKRLSGIPLTAEEQAMWRTAGAGSGVFSRDWDPTGTKARIGEEQVGNQSDRVSILEQQLQLQRDKEKRLADQDQWMRAFRQRQLDATKDWHRRVAEASTNKDILGLMRLNELRWWHDQISAWMIAKGDVAGDAEKASALQMMDTLQRMDRGEIPDDPGLLEQLGRTLGLSKSPTYPVQPRPPLTNERGVAPPMGKGEKPAAANEPANPTAFTGAPPGKNHGDTLKDNGKAVATWDSKTKAWVPIK